MSTPEPRDTTLPTELLIEVQKELDGEYTLQEIDDTAVWAVTGPVYSAAHVGLADGSERSIYFAASIFAGSMLPTYVKDGLINPSRVSEWVAKLPAKIAAQKEEQKAAEVGG